METICLPSSWSTHDDSHPLVHGFICDWSDELKGCFIEDHIASTGSSVCPVYPPAARRAQTMGQIQHREHRPPLILFPSVFLRPCTFIGFLLRFCGTFPMLASIPSPVRRSVLGCCKSHLLISGLRVDDSVVADGADESWHSAIMILMTAIGR